MLSTLSSARAAPSTVSVDEQLPPGKKARPLLFFLGGGVFLSPKKKQQQQAFINAPIRYETFLMALRSS
jgi:hypothetical protein